MSRLLVTGCSGFVGQVLVDNALTAGHEVWGADQTPPDKEFKGAQHIVCNLLDENAVDQLLDKAKPEQIVHLAAQSSVRLSFDDPAGTIVSNTVPALHILDYLRTKASACRLLAVGSADEYGPVKSPADLPLREDGPVNPVNAYALAKSIQNQYCRYYASHYGVDVLMTRSFNHTGAGQRDTFVLPSFAKQIVEINMGLRDAVIEVGNLEVRREFLDVRDVCAAYLALLRDGKKGETYNVCSGVSHRLRDLLDKMCELAAVTVEVKTDPGRLRATDTPELRGDAAKLREETGWSPAIPVEGTLRSLLDFWKTRLSASHGAGRIGTAE